ncbi:MAG: dipicolinate synthase subunit B [Hyphomonadaceae bacterium]|nr:dipicolinate synthase subunit B [Clostridia bacterium]
MNIHGKTIGFALTASFCTFQSTLPQIKKLVEHGANVIPIMSENAISLDTRFGKAADFVKSITEITGNAIINSILLAEPIGPKALLDALIVAPCTGNTLSKLANAITDTTVTMAAKAHMRNLKPLIIALSTNDGLAMNAKNIGVLLNIKNVFFVPFKQDDPIKKANSLIADLDLILPTIELALDNIQLEPVLL